jgi:aspartyl/asparaginyl-tRNA synthetase
MYQSQYPFKPIRYQNPPLRFTWPDIIKMLREAGETIGDMDDISTPQETLLGEIIAEKYQSDFYWVDKYPATVRPFYTMPGKVYSFVTQMIDDCSQRQKILLTQTSPIHTIGSFEDGRLSPAHSVFMSRSC